MRIFLTKLSLVIGTAVVLSGLGIPQLPSYAQSHQFNTSEARAHYDKAIELGGKSDWNGAVLELNRALQQEPVNPEILIELGIVFGELKQWDQAKKILQKAVELSPNSVRAHYNLGVTLDRAIPGKKLGTPEYRKALKLNPADVSSLVNLAANLGDENGEEARKLLEKASQIDPKNARAHFNLGLLLKNMGDQQGAMKALHKAIALDPEPLEPRRPLVALLVSEGKWDETIIQCQEILKRSATDWNTRYTLGQTLIRNGKVEAGRRELQKSQELRQSQQKQEAAEKMISRGVSALTRGEVEDGIKEFTTALEIDNGSSPAYMYLGVALATAGSIDQGIEKLNKAIELDPSSPRAHHNLGTVLMQSGRVDLAQREFEKALELDPYFPETHNNLGLIFSKNNQAEKAMEHFRLASELNPQYVEALFNLGLALRSANRVEEAAGAFRRAAELAPHNPQVHYALGMTLRDKGDVQGAKEALDRAEALQQQGRPKSKSQP